MENDGVMNALNAIVDSNVTTEDAITVAKIIVERHTTITIGPAKNVKTLISLSDRYATDVKPLDQEVVETVVVTTVEEAINEITDETTAEDSEKFTRTTIGIAQRVIIPTLPSEKSAIVAKHPAQVAVVVAVAEEDEAAVIQEAAADTPETEEDEAIVIQAKVIHAKVGKAPLNVAPLAAMTASVKLEASVLDMHIIEVQRTLNHDGTTARMIESGVKRYERREPLPQCFGSLG